MNRVVRLTEEGAGSMRSFIVLGTVLMALLEMGFYQPAMGQPKSEDRSQEEALREARRLTDELGDKIRGLLLQELQRGGAPSAVRVCSEVAQEMTREFNRQTGHFARRVSVRYRNPQNIPDDYEQRVLERMEADRRQSHLAKEYVEVVKERDVNVIRYVRPLTVVPVCLNCHGPSETMTPEVKRMIAERYPDDRAIGFQDGDLRGAISIKIVLKPESSK
jgi:hypothetical protein